MIVCLQLFQETTSPASVKIYPEVDFNISTQRAQLTSEYLAISRELDFLYVSMRHFVYCKYLRTF